MFNPSEIGINPTICNQGSQGLNQLAQATYNLFYQISQGTGSILRFTLTANLAAGGSAAATIQRFEGGAFVDVGTGTVYDEEPGGFWSGVIGDEGWCTGRDGSDGDYSIVIMPEALSPAGSVSTEGDTTNITNGMVTVPFRNDALSTASTGAMMEVYDVTDIAGVMHFLIRQPTAEYSPPYLINVGDPVLSGGVGDGSYLFTGGRVLLAGGPWVNGDRFGPYPGSWFGTRHQPGFEVIGDPTGQPVAIQRNIPELWGVAQSDADFEDTLDVEILATTVVPWVSGADSGSGLFVYDCVNRDDYIESGDLVKVSWAPGYPVVELVNRIEAYFSATFTSALITSAMVGATEYLSSILATLLSSRITRTSGTEITVEAPGIYEITVCCDVQYNGASAAEMESGLDVNASEFWYPDVTMEPSTSGDSWYSLGFTTLRQFDFGDVVKLIVKADTMPAGCDAFLLFPTISIKRIAKVG